MSEEKNENNNLSNNNSKDEDLEEEEEEMNLIPEISGYEEFNIENNVKEDNKDNTTNNKNETINNLSLKDSLNEENIPDFLTNKENNYNTKIRNIDNKTNNTNTNNDINNKGETMTNNFFLTNTPTIIKDDKPTNNISTNEEGPDSNNNLEDKLIVNEKKYI